MVPCLERGCAAARALRALSTPTVTDDRPCDGRDPSERVALEDDVYAAERLIRLAADDPEACFVLREHYIRGRTWHEIASRLERSDRHVYKVRRRGLALIRGALEGGNDVR